MSRKTRLYAVLLAALVVDTCAIAALEARAHDADLAAFATMLPKTVTVYVRPPPTVCEIGPNGLEFQIGVPSAPVLQTVILQMRCGQRVKRADPSTGCRTGPSGFGPPCGMVEGCVIGDVRTSIAETGPPVGPNRMETGWRDNPEPESRCMSVPEASLCSMLAAGFAWLIGLTRRRR